MHKPSKYYFDRAAEAMAIAKTMHNDASYKTWVQIARGYEALGKLIDQRNYDLEQRVLAALRATPGGSNALADFEASNAGREESR
jgi:hypothetical protein